LAPFPIFESLTCRPWNGKCQYFLERYQPKNPASSRRSLFSLITVPSNPSCEPSRGPRFSNPAEGRCLGSNSDASQAPTAPSRPILLVEKSRKSPFTCSKCRSKQNRAILLAPLACGSIPDASGGASLCCGQPPIHSFLQQPFSAALTLRGIIFHMAHPRCFSAKVRSGDYLTVSGPIAMPP